MFRILLVLFAANVALGQSSAMLRLHENGRVLGMGGAFVAVADDPQAGLLNPAGLRFMKQIGTDISRKIGEGSTADQFAAAIANPGTESGAAFCSGVVIQGLTDDKPTKFYMPFVGTCWSPLGGNSLGLTGRFPYRKEESVGGDSRWEAIGDLSVLQSLQQMKFGAQVERMFGGAADTAPRRLRMGASLSRPAQYAIAFEWRGTGLENNFDFHWDSSHLGGEVLFRNYGALRAGYIWSEKKHVTIGTAIGLMDHGWHVELAWDIPTRDPEQSRWSVGIGFRG